MKRLIVIIIYYPKAYFLDEEGEEIKVEKCNKDKLGSKYKHFLKNSELSNYYCLNKVNYTFISYVNSIKLQLFPCKNTTENNNHCKPKGIINENINGKLLEIKFEDILITPLNYDTPIKERINLIYTTVFKTFGQYLFAEMQIVNIETSTNIIGFDFLTKPRKEYFIKYNSIEIIPQPGYDLNDETNNYPICEIEFQLNDKILLEKREYIQLINILGEVGGLMEMFYSFFTLISSFVSDILYPKTIANNLFAFDMNKKIILIKKEKKSLFKYIVDKKEEENEKIYKRIISPDAIKKGNKEKSINIKNYLEINDINSDVNLFNKNNIISKNFHNSENKPDNFDNLSVRNIFKYPKKNTRNILNTRTNKIKLNLITHNEKNFIINKINLTDILISICFCFKRKKRKVYKLLLDETMNVIMEKLDIFNLFRDLCSIENLNDNCNSGIIKMSKECSNNLQNIRH